MNKKRKYKNELNNIKYYIKFKLYKIQQKNTFVS